MTQKSSTKKHRRVFVGAIGCTGGWDAEVWGALIRWGKRGRAVNHESTFSFSDHVGDGGKEKAPKEERQELGEEKMI